MGLQGQKRGKYRPRTKPRPRTKLRKTIERYPQVAAFLRAGYSNADACRMAGFPPSLVKSSSKKIATCEEVQRLVEEQRQKMIAAGQLIAPKDLGDIAKVRLQEDLLSPPKGDKGAKARLGFIRTGLESAQIIGGPAEFHLYAPGQICSEAAAMIAQKVLELQRRQSAIEESGISVNERPLLCQDAEAEPVPQPEQQEQPQAAIQADTPLIEEKELLEQTRLTFQSRPMARYSNGKRIS